MIKKRAYPALERLCLFFIKSGIYLSLFTPFIVNNRSFFPFVTPKTIYFRVLIEVVFAFYVIIAIFIPRYRPRLNSVFIAILAFILVLILTSFLGVNFERSFWSVYERMTGIFTFLHLLAFFIVLISVFKNRDDWRKLFAVSVFVGVLICINLSTGTYVSGRGGSTIGNTSFMAAYLLFDVFFALFLFLENKNTGWRIFSGISLLFIVPALLTSTARGAIICFFFGLFLVFLGALIFSKEEKVQKIGRLLIFIIAGFTLILLIIQPSFIKNRIVHIVTEEMRPRIAVWETGWKGFLQKPIFGWGPENFNIVFTTFFDPCMFTPECGGEIWFDRAHNIILDVLVTTGIVGFVVYLLIFGVCILHLLKICLKREGNVLGALIMMVLLVSYFLHNMLVFDMISSYVVFFLTLGFISFLITEDEDSFSDVSQNACIGKKNQQIIIGLVALLTLVLLYYGNIQPYLSARNIVNMIVLADNLEEDSIYFNRALNTYMYKYEIREQFAQKIYQESMKSGYPENIEEYFDLAEKEMQKSVERDPIDFRPRLFLGRTYLAHFRISYDQNILNLAEKTLTEAMELSPNNQQSYWHIAEVELFKSNYKSAYDYFQRAIDLEPRYGRSHWFLAMAYKVTGNYELAFAKLQEAEKYGYNWKGNMADLMNGIEIYKAIKGEQASVEIVGIYEEAVKNVPDNAQLWAYLAAAYANIGEMEKAREAALKVGEIDPSLLPNIEKFLQEL